MFYALVLYSIFFATCLILPALISPISLRSALTFCCRCQRCKNILTTSLTQRQPLVITFNLLRDVKRFQHRHFAFTVNHLFDITLRILIPLLCCFSWALYSTIFYLISFNKLDTVKYTTRCWLSLNLHITWQKTFTVLWDWYKCKSIQSLKCDPRAS